MDSIEGFILAGGASSRMGTNKARLSLGGQTFVERIAGALSLVASSVRIVGSNTEVGSVSSSQSEREAGNSLAVVADVFEKWGALGGLHAALSASSSELAIAVACDLPFVTSDLFVRLVSLCGDYDAVAPVQPDGRPQPLCAIYRTAVCRPASEKLIKDGERRPVTLLQSLRTRWVAFAELADLEGAGQFFENVNTPEDYARAQLKVGGSAL